jgi:integrase
MSSPHESLEAYRRWLVAAGRPRSTVYLRCYQVERWLTHCPDAFSVNVERLAWWLSEQRWSPETRRSYRAALIGFYRWAVATGRAATNPAADLPVVKVPQKAARAIPDSVVRMALLGADNRLGLMIELGWRCGLRRGEIAKIHGTDLLVDAMGWTVLVHGKGGKERIVPVPDDLGQRLRAAAKAGDGWVFPGAINGHVSDRWVGDLVGDALPAPWTCHSLRHRFATNCWESTHDLFAVQELLGHAKPETTRIYVGVLQAALRAATAWAA